MERNVRSWRPNAFESLAALIAFVTVAGTPACMTRTTERIIDNAMAAASRSAKSDTGSSSVRHDEPARMLITPPDIDFGETILGVESQQSVVLSNPMDFAQAVMQVTFDRACFRLSPRPEFPLQVPPHGEATVSVAFRPLVRGLCEGTIAIEVDSATRRIRVATLKGRGV